MWLTNLTNWPFRILQQTAAGYTFLLCAYEIFRQIEGNKLLLLLLLLDKMKVLIVLY